MTTSELNWFKSSYSSGSSGDCVEVAAHPAGGGPSTIHVRDSKNARGAQLTLSPGAWAHFVLGVSGPRSTA
ncbi:MULTISPECIES: DUF397 domain-containing protein [Streptomyces]|uniref:DUF397 domain-containing protein n=1 Tax=Streptomyces apricus TaxID=1828112 RepID=A0A5B0BKS4_9ACTN|nr:DUF397 domain-containing protein [Streptomyces apricus]KAA0941489.1 DUF397 domain-containing protein [Streptomyces apricus]